MKVPLLAASTKVTSFKALEESAPITLEVFLTGYRDAMADVPVGDARESE